MSKACTFCGDPEHTQFYCRKKPRTPIKTNKLPNKIGKVGRATESAVAKWKRTQKPNHQGYYQCYIGSDMIPYLVAEHPYSKARHPDMRTTQKFEPVCNEHNKLKGSLDIDEFLEKYPEFKQTVKKEYLKEIS